MHTVTPAQLWVDVSFLRQLKRFNEVERALQAFLKHQSRRAEPWMYLLLATVLEINGRPQSDVRTALGWAGYLARKQGDPFSLIEVADIMILRGHFDIDLPGGLPAVRAGELLDLAAEKAPNRADPILLSLLLAEKTKDAERFGAAAEQLLALGWPGVDEPWRRGLRQRAEALSTRLEEDGLTEPARRLLERVTLAETRDVFLRLTWKGNAWIGLEVEEPLGARATHDEPRTVFGGAILKSGRGRFPESTYSCPRGFDGDYRVYLRKWFEDENDPAREITLEIILHEGLPNEQRLVRTMRLDATGPEIVTLKGGRRTQVLPLQASPRMVEVPGRSDERKSSTDPAARPRNTARSAADALRGGETAKPSRPPEIKTDDASAKKSPRR